MDINVVERAMNIIRDIEPSRIKVMIFKLLDNWFLFLSLTILSVILARVYLTYTQHTYSLEYSMEVGYNRSIAKTLDLLNQEEFVNKELVMDLFHNEIVYDSLINSLNLNTTYIPWYFPKLLFDESPYLNAPGPLKIFFDNNHKQILGKYIKITELDSSNFQVKMRAKDYQLFYPTERYIRGPLQRIDTTYQVAFKDTIESELYKFKVERNNFSEIMSSSETFNPKLTFYYGYIPTFSMKRRLKESIQVAQVNELGNRFKVKFKVNDLEFGEEIAKEVFTIIEKKIRIQINENIEGQISTVDQSLKSFEAALFQNDFGQSYYDTIEKLNSHKHTLEQLLQYKFQLWVLKENLNFQLNIIEESRYLFSPSYTKVYLIALILCVLPGFWLVYLLSLFSTRIKGRKDITKITSIPIIGMIYKYPFSKVKSRQDDMGTHFEESMGRFKYNIFNEECQVLLFTSSVGFEGKSFLATRLAFSMAYNNARIALVDFDLRKPTIHKVFDVNQANPGVSSFLLGDASYEDLLIQTEFKNLKIITAGPPTPYPQEIIATNLAEQLIEKLKGDFDYIILDSPPLLPVADSNYLLSLCQLAFIVIKSNYTRKEYFATMLKEIYSKHLSKVRIVLNFIEPTFSNRYNFYYVQRNDKHKN